MLGFGLGLGLTLTLSLTLTLTHTAWQAAHEELPRQAERGESGL